MAAKRSFQYKQRSTADFNERRNMRSREFDDFIKPGLKKFKPRDGKNRIRILPPTWEEANHYGFDLWVNYGIGPDNQPYLSLAKMKGQKDPIEEAYRVAAKDGDDKLMKELAPRRRILMWVIDRDAEEEGPQLWPAPFSFDSAVLNICSDEDTGEIVVIDEPEDGHDIRFYKEGQGLTTKYDPSKIKLLESSPIHEDEKLQAKWLEYIQEHPLPEVLQFYDYDYISNVFNGASSSKASNDEEGEEVAPRRRTTTPQPVDEDEEPTPPARRAKPEPVEDTPAPPTGSIRDRIRRRQMASAADED